MKFGVSLLRVNPRFWIEVATEAEELGFESVWLSDHLVLPEALRNDVDPSRPMPIVPTTPVFDVWAYLAAIASRTSTIRLGTYVYQLALRHPFIAARSIATVDVISGGRVEAGIGAGYVRAEWDAAQVDYRTRGKRFDEAIQVCKRLWSEETIAHSGDFFSFDSVAFEPKPTHSPWPPLHIGGESPAALRRAAKHGDGWIAPHHHAADLAPILDRVREAERDAAREIPLILTAAAYGGPIEDLTEWNALGVDRLIVSPWTESRHAIDGLRAFAKQHIM